jgi:hypothetical protein
LRQALAHARELAHLPDHASIDELPVRRRTFVGRVLGVEGLRAQSPIPMPPDLRELVEAMGPFLIYSGDQPLALSEWVSPDP